MKRVLVCEDEDSIREFVVINLVRSGYEVVDVNCGEDALKAYDEKDGGFDVALLDIMMPGIDGMQVCKKIREKSNTIGIIMLSAKSQEMDKISCLMSGADDYITKPFNILEVKARIKAIIRRNRRKTPAVQEEPKVIVSGSMRLDIDAKRLYIDEKEIRLTVKEFDILKLLAENPGKIYSREQLLTLIWGTKYPGDARTVDVNVRRLREKIEENPAKPEYVHTKWGMGYYFQG